MKILITICARGGSKGIPGKNIKNLAGTPLIFYTLKQADQFAKIHNADIVISTDDEEIKDVAKRSGYGVNTTYTRPSYLATDTAGKLDVIKDVKNHFEEVNNIEYDYVIDLDVTSPLRTIYDLEQALEIIKKNDKALNLFSVNKANRNPYFNMVEENKEGFFELCKKGEFLTRQAAPNVYDLNASFYIFKDKFFNEGFKTVISDASLVYVMPHICFDLDHPIDFTIMDFLISENKLDFEL